MKKQNIVLTVIVTILLTILLTILPNNIVNAADRDIVVVLDPGHGGSDVGAVGGGIYEKDVNWKIATRVKQILDAEPGITGILSRGENECPSLVERALVAKNNGADLLVSFHINSNDSANWLTGAEVYVTANPNSTRFHQSSSTLAYSVLDNLRRVGVPTHSYTPRIKYSDERYYSDGFRADWYGIIREPMNFGIPGVLIEHCFINNPADRENFLSSDDKINQMAEADARAIIANKELFRINKEDNFTNASIDSLTINSAKTHLTGEATIVDWINGMQTVPTGTPTIKLKSTDGTTTINCYVTQAYGNKYYFDTHVSGIDTSKEYTIEISSQDRTNIPTNYTSKPGLGSDRIIGEDNYNYYYVRNSKLVMESIEYVGDVTSEIQTLEIGKQNGNNYMTGEIMAIEWVNGKSTVPRKTPTIVLKSTDGTVTRNCYVRQISGNTYYFDLAINGMDTSKEYTMEISSSDPNNLSTNKAQVVNISKFTSSIGRYEDKSAIIKDNILTFEPYTYVGNLNTELFQFNKSEQGGAAYVSGEIVVVEWVDNVSTVPTKTPKMRFVSTDGTVDMEVFVTPTGTNTYYFDRYIEGIDTSKEYKFIVESTDPANVSEYNKVPVYFKGQWDNKTIGDYHGLRMKLQNNSIVFTDYTYVGDLNTELFQFNKSEQGGAAYISGEIVVVEWVDGVSTVPTKTPKMRFVSTDGTVDMEVFVTPTGTNTYYFDRYIEGIDTTKEYKFMVESTDPNNVSEYNKVPVYFKGQWADKIIGDYYDTKIKLSNNRITFFKENNELEIKDEENNDVMIKEDKDNMEKVEESTQTTDTIEKTNQTEINQDNTQELINSGKSNEEDEENIDNTTNESSTE